MARIDVGHSKTGPENRGISNYFNRCSANFNSPDAGNVNRAGSNLILATLTEQQKNEIVKAGVDTMGNEDVFFRWLWTTLLGEQAKPIDMIRTGEVARVMELLGRIEHSVYS